MYTSELRYWPRRVAAAALLCLAFAACGDPLATRQAPALPGMTLFLVVDPDSATHPLLLKAADEGSGLRNLRVELRSGGSLVPVTVIPAENEGFELQPCIQRYGTIVGGNAPQCLNLSFAVQHGATYELRVFADEQPTASATFTVPGAFSITRAEARGTPPGSAGLDVAWTPSPGAYRYVVAVRPQTAAECVYTGGCQRDWFATTTEPSLGTVVPAGELDGAKGPFFVDVYAVDEAIYHYLTSGVADDLFPVPPVQNVRGGLGAAGAWVRRTRQVP
jgi:hypothetical protein